MHRPLVSVVIPAYNAEKYLAETVTSVLSQTYPNIECIVVNDGSTDRTDEIALQFGDRIRYFQKINGGVSSARNHGIRESSGDFVAFLDADDLWSTDKIEVQMGLAQNLQEVGIVVCSFTIVDELKRPISTTTAVAEDTLVENLLLLRPNSPLLSSTGLVRRNVFDVVGMFDEELSTSADCDFLCRASSKVRILAVDESLGFYRQHSSQMHLNLDALEHDMQIIYEKMFESPSNPANLIHLRGAAFSRLHSTLSISYFSNGNYSKGAVHFARSVAYSPSSAVSHFGTYFMDRIVTSKGSVEV